MEEAQVDGDAKDTVAALKKVVKKATGKEGSESESESDDEEEQDEKMKVARKLFEKRKPLFEDDLQLEADRKMKAAKH